MRLHSNSFEDGAAIPPEFCFGRMDDPMTLSDNRNPHLAWEDVTPGTRSFVLLCVDPDVPGKPDDVNQSDREVPAGLERVEFTHWAMIDIPEDCRELAAGSCSDGITEHGKKDPDGPGNARQGLNDFTSWFEGDDAMQGNYFGYDGPCPPWNDSIMHHYHFRLFALDEATLHLPAEFTVADVRKAMQGHVLAQAHWMGTYSLNPRLVG